MSLGTASAVNAIQDDVVPDDAPLLGSIRGVDGDDGEAMSLVHSPPSRSQYLKSAMFGGIDGLTTVFVAVATVFGSTQTDPSQYVKFVLIVGVAKLLAGALSMGIGDFLSSKAEVQHIKTERSREQWEFSSYPQGEKKEMVELYVEQGLSKENAEEVVEIMSRHDRAFVDVMMVQELGMEPSVDESSPWKNGLVNFTAFMVLGSMPLLAYIICGIIQVANKALFPKDKMQDIGRIIFFTDCGVTVLTLVLVGFIKSRFGDQKWYWAVISTTIVGVLAAGSGWGTSALLEYLFNFSD